MGDTKAVSDASPPKKHKKHKHKKQKKHHVEEDNAGELIITEEVPATLSKSKLPTTNKQTSINASSNKKRKKRDSASSDEERWLTAIESGKLEDVDEELKKIKPKDPALMTARQRAMYDRSSDGSPAVAAPTLMSLPSGYKEKVMTAEAIQKAAIKSQKRKQLADEKREKDKKKTMERLLKKQESKTSKFSRTRTNRNSVPIIFYKQNSKITTLSFPHNADFPLKPEKIQKPPLPKFCIMGCGNLRKYTCSQTGVALCSLACYKQNIANRIL